LANTYVPKNLVATIKRADYVHPPQRLPHSVQTSVFYIVKANSAMDSGIGQSRRLAIQRHLGGELPHG
jgi:hypothetical protein